MKPTCLSFMFSSRIVSLLSFVCAILVLVFLALCFRSLSPHSVVALFQCTFVCPCVLCHVFPILFHHVCVLLRLVFLLSIIYSIVNVCVRVLFCVFPALLLEMRSHLFVCFVFFMLSVPGFCRWLGWVQSSRLGGPPRRRCRAPCAASRRSSLSPKPRSRSPSTI